MATNQTKKSKYPSKYSPSKYVTAAQYIIELVCEKKAAFDKTNLPVKFWEIPKWKNFFMRNLRQVHKLLKSYDEQAMIAALNSPKFTGCYSIFTDRFIKLVEVEQKKYTETEAGKSYTEINRNTLKSKPRTQKSSNTLIDKLSDI